MKLMNKATIFFEGWNEALIWSCLDGYMGRLTLDDSNNPTAAMIDIGDFCFFAGEPQTVLLSCINQAKLLIPRDKPWESLIESYYGDKVRKLLRYAIKKEKNIFDRKKLDSYVRSISNLGEAYELKMIDREIFESTKIERWSVDLCSQFENFEFFETMAFGAVILHNGELVSGASPYAVYKGGIEIEVDTKPEYRNRGLATICSARLMLECINKGIYPSWDAHDLRSVALAEKLGYHLDSSYVTYELMWQG